MADTMIYSLSIFLISTFVEALSCGDPWRYMDSYEIDIDMIPGRHLEF